MSSLSGGGASGTTTLGAWRTSTTARTSTTLTIDESLQVTITQAATYRFSLRAMHSSSGVYTLGVGGSSGGSCKVSAWWTTTSTTLKESDAVIGTLGSGISGPNGATGYGITMDGYVTVTSIGTLGLMWASGDGGSVNITGGVITAVKIS